MPEEVVRNMLREERGYDIHPSVSSSTVSYGELYRNVHVIDTSICDKLFVLHRAIILYKR